MEIPFSIPVSGTIRIDGDKIAIHLRPVKMILDIPSQNMSRQTSKLESGRSMDSVVLNAALKLVRETRFNIFTGPELFKVALENNPNLNRRSFMSRVIAVTPTHPSYHHFGSGKNYFLRLDRGQYSLNPQYAMELNIPGVFPNNP